jgi:integrase
MAKSTEYIGSFQAPEGFTVADLVRQFIGSRTTAASARTGVAVRRPASRQQAEWSLLGNIINRLGQTSIGDVTRQEVAELLREIARRGAPITANRVYYLLRQSFRFAVAQGLILRSPIDGLPLPGGRESRRTRVLSDAEIPVFWQRIESANMAASTRLGLMILLVVAQRPGELAGARWLDVDLDKRIWFVPGGRSLSGRPHEVPLSQLAIELLAALRCITGNATHLLASPRTVVRSGSPYSAGVLSHAVRRNESHWGIERFTPYDLRRTAAHGMFKIGVPPRHILKTLNRSISAAWAFEKVGRDYFPEKQAALNRWAAHIEGLVGIVRANPATTSAEAVSPRPKACRRRRSRVVAHKVRRLRRRLPK